MSIRALPIILLLALCAACGGRPAGSGASGQAERDAREYLKPPSVLTAQIQAGGSFQVEGVAHPNALVRLIQSDDNVQAATADAEGHWSMTVRAAPAVRLFVLAMKVGARTVVSEGFLMLAPDGRAAQLRAGSASQVLTPVTRTPRILNVDFDRDGGAIIAGVAPAASGMNIRVDRAAAGDVTADSEGRFVAAIRRPLSPGRHLIDISGDAGGDQIVVAIDAAAPPADGPFRATRLDGAWRIDWLTPAGGVQSSVIVTRSETGA